MHNAVAQARAEPIFQAPQQKTRFGRNPNRHIALPVISRYFKIKPSRSNPVLSSRCAPPTDPNNKYSIVINGRFIAEGTEADPILITSAADTPQPGDWDYIEMTDLAIPALYNPDGTYKEGSILTYVTIEYGGAVTDGETYKYTFQAKKAPYFDHLTVRNNSSGGLSIETSTIVENSDFTNNYTPQNQHGGAISAGVGTNITLTLNNCTFTNNYTGSGGVGGAIRMGSWLLTITGCTFTGNHSPYNGGAITTGAVLDLSDSEFSNNSAVISGGAIALEEYYWDENMSVVNCTFTGNTAENGGAIKANIGDITNSIFIGNSSNADRSVDSTSGGAIHLYNGSVNTSIFYQNAAHGIDANAFGGALYGEFVTVSESIFVNNTADNQDGWASGGAIGAYHYNGDCRITANDSLFIYNPSPGTNDTSQGAVLDVIGQLDMSRCLVYKSDGMGVYIRNGGITDSTIVDHGGGVFIYENGQPTISGTNLYGNIESPQEYELYNDSAKGITATGNYWGTTSEQNILAFIWDYYDNNQKGEVDFGALDDSYLAAFNNDAPAVPDKIIVSLKTHDYGRSDQGANEVQNFAVANAGDSDLTISGMTITGQDVSEFDFGDNGCAGQTLAPYEMCTFEMVYTRNGLGRKTANIEITSDDASSPTKVISIEGMALSNMAGDLNNDGQVDMTDLILILRICTGLPVDVTIFMEADVNGDSLLDITEGIYISRFLAD